MRTLLIRAQNLSENFARSTAALGLSHISAELGIATYVRMNANYLFACGTKAFVDAFQSELVPDLWTSILTPLIF